jgi:uncharacterized protein (TIGR00299 family) protein
MTLAWFDAGSGASGDMVLGALLDAGAPLATVQAAVDALGVEPVEVTTDAVVRGALSATQASVRYRPSETTRTWRDVRTLVEGAPLADGVRTRALDVFARLARAEASVHGVAPDEVHFHEVGALDALADIVGSAAAFDALGITSTACSPVALGGGAVRAAHGMLPVPVPAVLEIFREAGAPVQGGPAGGETCTPTGAALLSSFVTEWGPLPTMRVTATGRGAGSREIGPRPNVLRVVLGEAVLAVDDVPVEEALVLEANVDDLDPRLWPGVLAALLAAGASDAWLTPILMKKGRPAHVLSVLTPVGAADDVRRVVFTESSTIGVREHPVAKHALVREERSVSVDGITVRVKVSSMNGTVVNVSPEYDDVAAAAAQLGRPAKAVLAAAVAAAHAIDPGA